jgi:beta-glucosidase
MEPVPGSLTLAQIQNADTLLHGGTNNTCHNVGPVGSPVGLDAASAPTATTLAGNVTTTLSGSGIGVSNIPLASYSGLLAGQTAYIDSGANLESAVIAPYGATTLGLATASGASNLKVLSVAGFAAGQTVNVDVNGTLETRTISAVGTAGATTLAAASIATATNIKVTSVTGFSVGDTITIDVGASAESRVILTVGTSGAGGTGITLTTPLTLGHASGASVAGSGISLSLALSLAHASGVAVSSFGFTAPLTKAHAIGVIVTNNPAWNPGFSDIRVANATGFLSGETIWIDILSFAESATLGTIPATTLAAASAVNDTNIKVASVAGFAAGDTITIDAGTGLESRAIMTVGTAGAGGTGITLTSALTLAHAIGAAVINTHLPLTAPLTKGHFVGAAVYAALTTPSITPICWTDAQGVLNTSGPNARGSTAPMTLMGLAAGFDVNVANAWGQVAGSEARAFSVTGIFGPQTDLDRLPNWSRNLTTTGEDAYLSYEMVAAQINGIQGVGAMSQMKHFAVYNGQNQSANTDVQDQALHELYLTPYEGGFQAGKAAATMCSYQIWRDTSSYLPSNTGTVGYPAGVSALAGGAASPYVGTSNPQTWPLNQSSYSCEQPLILTYVLRDMWGSLAFVGSDYPATHSTSGILQGEDQEMPTANGYFAGGSGGTDATGHTCATNNATSPVWDPTCAAVGTTFIGGIPNNFQNSGATGCPTGGCTLNQAVQTGNVPLSVFNQSLARVLYQEQRFGMLGCNPTPSALCTNPGGVGADRSGLANLPMGPTSGTPVIGTQNGDAAIVEKLSEEGATLLKNSGNALPLTAADAAAGILVTGAGANHNIADPTSEASTGMIGRDAVNALQQLKEFGPSVGIPASAFTYVAANDPDGTPLPTSALSSDGTVGGLGGLKLSIDGGPAVVDPNALDHSAVNGNQLAPGHTYTWTGWLYVPTSDTYQFAVQQGPTLPTSLNCPQTGAQGTPTSTPTLTLCSPFTAATLPYTFTTPDNVSFQFDGSAWNLNATTGNIYGNATVPSNPTTAGYTDQGLISRTCATGTTALEPGTTNCSSASFSLTGGSFHLVKIVVNNNTGCVSTPPAAPTGNYPGVVAVPATCTPASFRVTYNRTAGNIADAAAAAVGKSKAIVFVDDSGASSSVTNPYGASPATISAPNSLSAANINLITAVAAANPNTIVVVNNANPFMAPWIGSAKALLDMWFASQEGGTSTARILLGLANPSGHTALTWPANPTDTLWGYNETVPLYAGEPAGPVAAFPNAHLERLNWNYSPGPYPTCVNTAVSANTCTNETEGIFTGYKFFDKEGITPLFPFGYGLSYAQFAYSNLSVVATPDHGMDVTFKVTNTGTVAGADAAQVYVGPAAAVPTTPVVVQQAVRSLRQFSRVELAPGAFQTVTLHLDPRSFQYWDEANQKWTMANGCRTIWVGNADALANLPLSTNAACPLEDTSTSLVANWNPTQYNYPVTFTATVSASGFPTVPPAGTVQFKLDGSPVGAPVPINGAGQATWTTSSISLGTHSVVAVYSGTTGYSGSTSPTLSHTVVSKLGTSTAVVANINPSIFGQTVNLTATVTPQNLSTAITPAGNVQFIVDGVNVGSPVPLNASAQATLGVSTMSTGGHAVRAKFLGGANYTASNSPTISHTVSKAHTLTSLVTLTSPYSAILANTNYSATVTAVAPGAGIPTGTVQFKMDGTNLGAPATLVGGTATLHVNWILPTGNHVVRAVFLGSSNWLTSTGPTDHQTITP